MFLFGKGCPAVFTILLLAAFRANGARILGTGVTADDIDLQKHVEDCEAPAPQPSSASPVNGAGTADTEEGSDADGKIFQADAPAQQAMSSQELPPTVCPEAPPAGCAAAHPAGVAAPGDESANACVPVSKSES